MKTKFDDLKIYLLDIDPDMTEAWRSEFSDAPNVQVICMDFATFMDHYEVDGVVSPANSYALMDGGYDLAISQWFGWDLQKKVQKRILSEYYGEQPVGTSLVVDTGKRGIRLIHTPSMRRPSPVRDALVVYTCTRTALIAAMEAGMHSVVLPAFGALTGELSRSLVAFMMRKAWGQLRNPPKEIDWRYVDDAYFHY